MADIFGPEKECHQAELRALGELVFGIAGGGDCLQSWIDDHELSPADLDMAHGIMSEAEDLAYCLGLRIAELREDQKAEVAPSRSGMFPDPEDSWEAEEDPEYPMYEWRDEVSAGDTRLGYLEWVANYREADDLCMENWEDEEDEEGKQEDVCRGLVETIARMQFSQDAEDCIETVNGLIAFARRTVGSKEDGSGNGGGCGPTVTCGQAPWNKDAISRQTKQQRHEKRKS
jgi:hypothetical protein